MESLKGVNDCPRGGCHGVGVRGVGVRGAGAGSRQPLLLSPCSVAQLWDVFSVWGSIPLSSFLLRAEAGAVCSICKSKHRAPSLPARESHLATLGVYMSLS